MNKPMRLLIIDDSNYNRRAIAGFFSGYPDVQVVGKAADGQEGLQMALNEQPTVITLDLEMPKIDGFAFLRLLMSSQPTPVIIISSHSNKENVLRALELGALDFVAKPGNLTSPEIKNIKSEVVRKVLNAGRFNVNALRDLSSRAPATGLHYLPKTGKDGYNHASEDTASKVVAIGASTGGPASITRILSSLPADIDAAIVISQHMPKEFTTTFASRLNTLNPLTVVEVKKRQPLLKGTVYIAPGDSDLKISRHGKILHVERSLPLENSVYTPSVDRMLESAAKNVKDRLLAVILTGMGNDGTDGSVAAYDAGATVIVESETTAIVNGMPGSVLQTGIQAKTYPLELIAGRIVRFTGRTLYKTGNTED